MDNRNPVTGDYLVARFRELHRLSLSAYPSAVERHADYLATGRRLLGARMGVIARIEGDQYRILAVQPANAGVAEGDILPPYALGWEQMVGQGRVVALDPREVESARAAQSADGYSPHGGYVGAPIRVQGELLGTLTFARHRSRAHHFPDEDLELVELMAATLSRDLERERVEQQRDAAAERMRENIELFENAFRYAAIGKALVAPDGRWLRVNRALTDLLGYTEAELLAIDFQTLTHADDIDADLGHVRALLTGERTAYRMEKRYFHRDGRIVWVLLSVSLVSNSDGTPRYFISQIQDITEQKRAAETLESNRHALEQSNRELAKLAANDELTGVANRRAFDQRLDDELRRAVRSKTPVSLLLVDVDHFKSFNDHFGHPAGDRALSRVAAALGRTARATDFVARYGGEEFAVILPNTDVLGSELFADRVRAAIAGIRDIERPLTVSVGASTAEPTYGAARPAGAASLVRQADEALYEAKGAGRNHVCCYAAIVDIK